jgi:hypothetical protein
MKKVIENNTEKYLIEFIGEPNWMPSTLLFKERFIKNKGRL